MIKTMLIQSFIGLAILIVITLENLILCKKKTIPVLLCDQLFVSIIVIKFFGWITIVYSVLLLAFLLFIKYQNHIDESADLDYSGRIFSISAIFNKLKRPKKLVMGRILPVNHKEIKHNMKLIELDDIILSGATLITGSTGSGKNLHKDTIIPTVDGMKSIKEIKIGDIIFDDNGNQTVVIDKYSPNETDFYELTFSDGTKVKCGGGHLWKVELLYERIKRGNIQVDFSNIDLDNLKNCDIDSPITKKEFIEKYLNDGDYKKWDIFLNNNFKNLFYRLSNDYRYIDTNKILLWSQGRKYSENRIERIKKFQNDTKQNLMSNNEAKLVLTESKWDNILHKANIEKIDRLNTYCNEKDLCNTLYMLFEKLNNWVNMTRPIEIINTNELASIGVRNKYNRTNFAIRRTNECQYNSIDLPIKPYWLGAWLGDGVSDRQSICGVDKEIANRANQDYPICSVNNDKQVSSKLLYWNFESDVRHLLKENGLFKNKHIPEIYLNASISDKKELVAGIIDTDGYVLKNGTCSLSMTNRQVVESIRTICCSLGFDCKNIYVKQGKYKKNGKTVICKKVYTLNFTPNCIIPLQVPRKLNNLILGLNKRQSSKQQIKHTRLYIKEIRKIQGNSNDYFCLAVDSPTHMFLCTESYIPTHNTTTMKTILKQRIDERKPVVFFDYKGEEDILDDIKSYAQNAGIRYYEFSARKCTFTYDPFVNLNETGKVEALMNTRRWSTDGADEHYKTSMQLAIQNLVRAYDNYRFEQNETKNYIVGLYEYAKSYKPQSNEMDGFKNLIKSLEIIISSKAQELFGDDPDFTFEEDYPYVVCFSFTSANKALANSLSSFVYTDLMDRGTRNHYPNKLLLCVDEFGTLESSTLIKDLLEKGRSGGVQTVFSILDVNQISMNAGEHFVQAILGTINNYIIHAGATQKTAELLAGVQKFDKSYDIMSLRKPYRGKKPTALFISKYSIISTKGNQEVYRMIPYTKVLKIREKENYLITDKQPPKSNYTEEIVDNYVKPIEEIDLSMPIDNIDDYL